MYQTYYIICYLLILSFCKRSLGSDIFLRVTHNGNSTLYAKDTSIKYKVGDTVKIVCSVAGDVYTKHNFKMAWIKDGYEFDHTSDSFKMERSETLTQYHDGQILECKAEFDGIREKLSISLNFISNMTDEEKIMKNPNIFIGILALLGIFIATSIVLLLCYGIYKHLRQKLSTKDKDLETEKVTYAQIDLSKKIKNRPPPEDPLYAEIGHYNQSYETQERDEQHQIKEDDRQTSCHIQDDNRQIQINDEPDSAQTKVKSQINANVENYHGRHGSSTDC